MLDYMDIVTTKLEFEKHVKVAEKSPFRLENKEPMSPLV